MENTFFLFPLSLTTKTLFDLWTAILASMAETGKKGAITSAIVSAILYQVSKYVLPEKNRELLPKVQKALLRRIYMGYDTHAFEGTGAFILHDMENHFSRVDNVEKFVEFLVTSTHKWIGDKLKDRRVVRDLLTTFHPDHANLRLSLGDASHSRYTPWACDPGNDPRKVLITYFEEKNDVPSIKKEISDCAALFSEIRKCFDKIQKTDLGEKKRIPVRVVGKHTFTLVIPPIKMKDRFIFADTNWEREGQDLFLAFV